MRSLKKEERELPLNMPLSKHRNLCRLQKDSTIRIMNR
jgi:hypothetical protein